MTVRPVNDAPIAHDVAVAQGSEGLGTSENVKGGRTELRLDLQPGRYAHHCTIDGHRAAGMEGTLTVR